jgi:hypothetical protein
MTLYIYPPPVDLSGAFQVFFRDRVAGTTDLVSVPYEGTNVDYNPSFPGGVSADGRYVAFWSNSCNFVRGMQPGPYVRDLLTKTTEAVSVSSTEAVANNGTGPCAMTADGRYVVFTSLATNLVPSGANGHWQVYLRDRAAGTIEEVSVSSTGEQADGDSSAMGVGVSDDGRYVVFQSSATNLVPDDTNGCWDVFVRDRVTGVTCRVSVSSSGEQGDQGGGETQAISADGRYITFGSASTNLVPGATGVGIYVHDLAGPFSDVWETSWAYQAVAASASAGIVSGYPDGTYEPTDPVTRDQMAVYISRALAGGDAKVPTGPAIATFSDVPTDYWAFKYVEYAVSKAVVKGYSDGTYKPTEQVDRGQMAVFVARAIATPSDGADLVNYTPPATATFPDVATSFWAYKYVEYIAQPSVGVTKGYPDGDYHPEYICTRDQMAVYVARAFQLPL